MPETTTIDWSGEVEASWYRNGPWYPVRVFATDAAGDYPVVAQVLEGSNGTLFRCKPDGTFCNWTFRNKPPAPKEYVRWLNVYPNCVGGPYQNRVEADQLACSSRIARIKVAFTEGQFDE